MDAESIGQARTLAGDTSLVTAAPSVSLEEAAEIAGQAYGVRGAIRRLIGERDQNFAIETDRGEFALKLIHPAEDRAVTNFQTTLLTHLERVDPSLPVQRVVRTRDGAAEAAVRLADGSERMMRLVSFLPGRLLRGLPGSAARAAALGRTLAQLQRALASLAHPADGHRLAWDLAHTLWQRDVVPEIPDPAHRALMERALDRFERVVLPAMPGLRRQVVHNDLSLDNALVDPADTDRVAGVLDFGDATRTALVFDVAIAATYNLAEAGNPFLGAAPLVAAFHRERPLLPAEVALVADLIVARMVMRVGITEWRAVRFPENRDYILRATPGAWRLLERLLGLPAAEAAPVFLEACGMEGR